MKHALITASIITGLLQNVFGQKRNGWLLYWHDKIIWLEDSIGKKVEDSAFFKSNASYFNGLGVSKSVEANYYRKVANGKLIFHYNTSEVARKEDDSIWLLPVRVKLKFQTDTANFYKAEQLLFNYRDLEIYLEYRGVANYSIVRIFLLRSIDKRRLRKFKKLK